MEKPSLEPAEWIFSFSDVKQLYISLQKRLIQWAALGALLSFLCFGGREVQYKAEASFKEEAEKNSPENLFHTLLVAAGGGNQSQASSIMKSYQVLKPLIEKMGLQIALVAPVEGIGKKFFRRFIETFKAENGKGLEDFDSFVFQDVRYEGEKPFYFHILFEDPDHFVLYDRDKKKELGKGSVGCIVRFAADSEKVFANNFPYENEGIVEGISNCAMKPVSEGFTGEERNLKGPDKTECSREKNLQTLSEVQFTLAKAPQKRKVGSFYRLEVAHWSSKAVFLQKQICIKKDKDNKSILNLCFPHRDRYLAARVVNELMNQYQGYLKREYDHVAEGQREYLEGRQEQICGKMEKLFEEHTAYLGKNLEEFGLFALGEETETLLAPYQQMGNKILLMEVELSRLDKIEKEGKTAYLEEDLSVFQRIQDLKQQRDLLELSLCQNPTDKPKTQVPISASDRYRARGDELKEIRDQRYAVEKLLWEMDLGQEISAVNFNEGLHLWAQMLQGAEEKRDFTAYLENYTRLLSIREKMVQEQSFYKDQTPPELEGIDLPSSRTLFLEYNNKLDAAEALMRYYEQLQAEIKNPDFNLASLSFILKDPLSQKIIAHASELSVQLKDEKHRSSKEADRWKEEIALQKRILSDHLDQLYKVEALSAYLIRSKMAGLQKVSLGCINRQISVFHEQLRDSIKQKQQVLSLEKALLEKKMEQLRASFAALLPEKWRFEKWLQLKLGMLNKVMETVAGIVESKTISDHLHHVESKPLDCALVPIAAEKPRLFLWMALSAFAFPSCLFCFAFIRQAFRGFPLSLEKCKALHLPVLGSISAFCDGSAVETPTGSDLEALRQIALFAEGGKVIGLIGGRGPDYSYALGENLSRMSIRSFIVRCDFLSVCRPEDVPGLLQIEPGQIDLLPIRKGKGFDYIASGGFSSFGPEIIQSQNFSQLIERWKEKYDQIFLLFRSSLASAESIAALRLCEKAVVTVWGEQIEELTPFINWAYDGDYCRLKFITQS